MICVDRIEGIRVAVEGFNGCFFLLFLRAFVDIKMGYWLELPAFRCSVLRNTYAEVAELVDAPASGAGGGNPVEVQVLSSAPNQKIITKYL